MVGDEYKREFTFNIAKRSNNGWIHLQLEKIYDEPTVVYPNPELYDPIKHNKDTDTSYFSSLWPARWSNILQKYELYGAFGSPQGRIPLEEGY